MLSVHYSFFGHPVVAQRQSVLHQHNPAPDSVSFELEDAPYHTMIRLPLAVAQVSRDSHGCSTSAVAPLVVLARVAPLSYAAVTHWQLILVLLSTMVSMRSTMFLLFTVSQCCMHAGPGRSACSASKLLPVGLRLGVQLVRVAANKQPRLPTGVRC